MLRSRIRVDPWAYVFFACLLLTVPLDWLLGMVLAAAFHEVCHILLIRGTGGQVKSIRVGVRGAQIDTKLTGQWQELVCALAGPIGSFLLAAVIFRLFPQCAICAGIQGIFNLLPVYPLDGGRALRCILEICRPGKGSQMGERIEMVFLLGMTALLMAGCLFRSLGPIPFFIALRLLRKALLRKKSCKYGLLGVQ